VAVSEFVAVGVLVSVGAGAGVLVPVAVADSVGVGLSSMDATDARPAAAFTPTAAAANKPIAPRTVTTRSMVDFIQLLIRRAR
jgi:hypothetical protein